MTNVILFFKQWGEAMKRFSFTIWAGICILAASPAHANEYSTAKIKDIRDIEATCYDYIDGQLEGNPDRVARSMHPDVSKRGIIGNTPYERFGLRRMTKEELVYLTQGGILKTEPDKWDRTCTILDITGNTASVRLETPWFVDHFHIANFDGKWLIVNVLWYSKVDLLASP